MSLCPNTLRVFHIPTQSSPSHIVIMHVLCMGLSMGLHGLGAPKMRGALQWHAFADEASGPHSTVGVPAVLPDCASHRRFAWRGAAAILAVVGARA